MVTTPTFPDRSPLSCEPMPRPVPGCEGVRLDTMLIVCTDRALDARLLAALDKQPVLLWRSPGPIVPPRSAEDEQTEAAIEHAVHEVGVKEIAVCGHVPASVLGRLLSGGLGADHARLTYYARATLKLLEQKHGVVAPKELSTELVGEHVLLQLANLRTYPAVAAKLDRNQLSLHAWVYDAQKDCLFAHGPANSGLLRRLYQWSVGGEKPRPFLEPHEIYLA